MGKMPEFESGAAGEEGVTEGADGVEVPQSGVTVTPFSSRSRLPLDSLSTPLRSRIWTEGAHEYCKTRLSYVPLA